MVDNTGSYGVAITLTEAAQTALLVWLPASPRLASAHTKGAIVNLTVIAVYAPTLDAEEGVKASFYDDRQGTVGSVPSGHRLLYS